MSSTLVSLDNTIAIDLETECTVVGCKDYGKAICREDHSLSPWHSRITVIGIFGKIKGEEVKKVFREIGAFSGFIDSLDPLVTFVGHNFKFDLLHLHSKGVSLDLDRWVGDSQLAAYVCTEKIPDEWLAEYNEKRKAFKGQREAGKHSLKTLAPYFLGVEPFWEKEEHDNDEYVLRDCEYTYRLCEYLQSRLHRLEQFDFYASKQLPWTKLLLRAECRGISIDLTALDQMERDLTEKAEKLRHELNEQWMSAHAAYTEIKINEIRQSYKTQKGADNAISRLEPGVDYNSPKQMLWLLRDYYQKNCTSIEGDEGTGREILERLANEGHEDVEKFLEYRKVDKILTAFLPAYKADQVCGTLHPSFVPDHTNTGRLSSRSPNLQQVSGALKRLFTARPSCSFIGKDQSSIEVLLLALFTEDRNLYNIIESGQSYHNYSTRIIFGLEHVPLEDIPKLYSKERKAAKALGFLCFYGGQWRRLQATLMQHGFAFSDYEAKEIYKKLTREFEKVFEYADQARDEFSAGSVIPSLFGRPIKIQNPDDVFLKALNYIIQSSASDLCLEAARIAQDKYDQLKIPAQVIAFVHDFLMVEVEDEYIEQAEKILEEAMTGFKLVNCHGPIKLKTETFIGKTWQK